ATRPEPAQPKQQACERRSVAREIVPLRCRGYGRRRGVHDQGLEVAEIEAGEDGGEQRRAALEADRQRSGGAYPRTGTGGARRRAAPRRPREEAPAPTGAAHDPPRAAVREDRPAPRAEPRRQHDADGERGERQLPPHETLAPGEDRGERDDRRRGEVLRIRP